MIDLLGRILPEAVAYMINPMPIVILILLLTTPGAIRIALTFLLGWFFSCFAIVVVFQLIGAAWLTELPPRVEAFGKLGLGVLFAVLAVLEWVHRPRPGHPDKKAAVMKKLDGLTPAAGFTLGAVLPPTNLKNLSISAAVVYQIALLSGSADESVAAVIFLVVVGSMTLILPFAIYLIRRQRAVRILAEWREWLVANDTAILLIVLTLLSAISIGEAVQALR